MTEISTDGFSILEYMAKNGSGVGDRLTWKGSLIGLFEELGLKNQPRERTGLMQELKDAGVATRVGKTWLIDLTNASEVDVAGLSGKVSDFLEVGDEVVDLTEPVADEQLELPSTIQDQEPQATIEERLDRVSSGELAAGIAQELFDRLESAERRIHEEVEKVSETARSDAAKLQALLDAEVAKRKAAEKAAVENKMKAERLETQYAQMMREMASTEDGDAIKASAKRFLQPHVDGPGRVAAASVPASK